MPPAALRAGGALFAALLVVPWLWPFTVGPSPNVVPLLASWACLLLALPLGAWLAAAGAPLRPLVPAAWLLAALLSSAIGLAQWFGAAPATDWISDASIGEAFGNLRQRNHFASLTSIGLAALLLLAGRTRPRWLWSGAAWLALANAASASRTGLLQWLVLALLFALWPGPRRERTQLALVALAAYAAAAFALPIALWEWRGVEPANAFGRAVSELGCSSRRVLWSNVLHLIAQRPWTGWGVGELDFAHYMTLYPGDRFCDILDNAHNLPLHLAVELGVPAALAVVVATAVLVWRARPWQETDPQRQFAWAVLALIGLHSLVEYPLWYGPFQLAAVVCVALLLPVRPPGIRARIACVVLALVGLASLASVHALYDRVSDAYRLPAQRRPELRQDPVTPLGRPPLFDAQVRFAELSITELSPANARHVHQLAQEVLHYSPEARVVEKLIESATLLGHTDEAVAHLARFKAAFPQRYAQWAGTPRTSGPGTAAPQR